MVLPDQRRGRKCQEKKQNVLPEDVLKAPRRVGQPPHGAFPEAVAGSAAESSGAEGRRSFDKGAGGVIRRYSADPCLA